MFSDSSDSESDDVAVIRYSILEPSEHFPFIQSLSQFAKQACGWSGSLKKFLFAQAHEQNFAAIALCPPVAVALQSEDAALKHQLRSTTRLQEGCETKEYSAVATGGHSLAKCQALAVQALLKKLHADGLIQKFSPTPTQRVCLPGIEVCLPGGATHHIPLFITEAQISSYPLLKPPESHPVVYIHRSEQLSEDSEGGNGILMQHLFPNGVTTNQAQISPSQGAVVGFDLEWRPTGQHNRAQHGFSGGESAPVSVIQLSSPLATVVVNVFALGRSMKPHSTVHGACAAGAAIVQPVFESQELVKVGLGCYEDLRRLKLMLPQCEFPNTTDLKELAESVGLQKQGLRSLAAATLRQRLSKSDQCSDWQQMDLTPEQVEYAAVDALATRQVYEFLLKVQEAVSAGKSKRVPHKNVDQVLRQLPQLLQNALAAGAIDADHNAPKGNIPTHGFAPPQQTPPGYRSGAGRGRGGARTPPARYAGDAEGQCEDWGPGSSEQPSRGRFGQGTGAHRDQGPALGRGRDAGDTANDCGGRWGHGGSGRGGRGRGRGRACNHVDLTSTSAEDALAGNVDDMHVGARYSGRGGGRGWGRAQEDINTQHMHMQRDPGCKGQDVDHRDHNTVQGGGWKDGGRKRRARGRGRGRHNDTNDHYDRHVAVRMQEDNEPNSMQGGRRGRGGRVGYNRALDTGLAVDGRGHGGGAAQAWGRGRRGPQQQGNEQGAGFRGSKNDRGAGGVDMGYGGNGGNHASRADGPHHTWGDRGHDPAPHYSERCRERTCGPQGGPNRKERERSPQRVGRRRQARRNRKQGKWEDSRGRGQDDENDCYRVPDGNNVHSFDPREIPTALYLAIEKEAQRQFAEQPPPEVVALSAVKTSGHLPVAAPKLSRFDVMEHYFASVEAVAQDVNDGWVKAWGIKDLKESDYYKKLLSHFGGTD